MSELDEIPPEDLECSPPTPSSGLVAEGCSLGSYYLGSDGAVTCASCDSEAFVENCENCDNGFDGHDCGEDCCCAEPEENVVCHNCGGEMANYYCEFRECEAFELTMKVKANTHSNANQTPSEHASD